MYFDQMEFSMSTEILQKNKVEVVRLQCNKRFVNTF